VNTQKSWLLFLLGILVTLNLYFHFTFEGTEEDRGRWIDQGIARVLLPVQWTFEWAFAASSTTIDRWGDLWKASEENEKLKSELNEAHLSLQKLGEVEAENERLRSHLQWASRQKMETRTAQVIRRDINLFYQSLEVSLGEGEGIEKGMPVLAQEGVVGRVLRVGPTSATVLLISDINFRVDGVIQRSRAQVIVGGDQNGDLRLEMLPRRADVRPGDTIVTGGVGRVFPAGYKIGTIISNESDPHSVLEGARIDPAVNLAQLEEVFIVTHGTR